MNKFDSDSLFEIIEIHLDQTVSKVIKELLFGMTLSGKLLSNISFKTNSNLLRVDSGHSALYQISHRKDISSSFWISKSSAEIILRIRILRATTDGFTSFKWMSKFSMFFLFPAVLRAFLKSPLPRKRTYSVNWNKGNNSRKRLLKIVELKGIFIFTYLDVITH